MSTRKQTVVATGEICSALLIRAFGRPRGPASLLRCQISAMKLKATPAK